MASMCPDPYGTCGSAIAITWVVRSTDPDVERVVMKLKNAWKKLPIIERLTPLPRPVRRIVRPHQVSMIHRMLKHLQAPNCAGGLK